MRPGRRRAVSTYLEDCTMKGKPENTPPPRAEGETPPLTEEEYRSLTRGLAQDVGTLALGGGVTGFSLKAGSMAAESVVGKSRTSSRPRTSRPRSCCRPGRRNRPWLSSAWTPRAPPCAPPQIQVLREPGKRSHAAGWGNARVSTRYTNVPGRTSEVVRDCQHKPRSHPTIHPLSPPGTTTLSSLGD
jgi:hypothetical protein